MHMFKHFKFAILIMIDVMFSSVMRSTPRISFSIAGCLIDHDPNGDGMMVSTR